MGSVSAEGRDRRLRTTIPSVVPRAPQSLQLTGQPAWDLSGHNSQPHSGRTTSSTD